MHTDFNYILALLTGIAGAFHCIGMCGGMASGYFAGHGWRNKITPQLTYHTSRITVYVLFAVIGAQLGRTLVQTGMTGKVQGVVFMISGLLIILIGLWLFINQRKKMSGAGTQSRIVHFDQHKPTARFLPIVMGVLNGFVPCSLLFSVMLKAVASSDPLHAGLLMLSFGLGTLPTMLLVTTLGAAVGEKTRGVMALVASLVVIGFGLWTLYEGWFFFDIMRGLAS